MLFEKERLDVIRKAVNYAILNTKDLEEKNLFAELLIDVEAGIESYKLWDKKKLEMEAHKGCPFSYCDSKPRCEESCRHKE